MKTEKGEEYMGNGLFRSYIGAETLQKARRLLSEGSGQPERDLNKECCSFQDPNYLFVKFDFEYVYFRKVSSDEKKKTNFPATPIA